MKKKLDDSEIVRVFVYIDFLNFFHSVMETYKMFWINLETLMLELVRNIEPTAEIEKIYIFSADFIDENQKKSQQKYFKALTSHSDKIIIVPGKFKNNVSKYGKLYNAEELNKNYVSIHVQEEKQTDVNLTCQMLYDAFIEKDKINLSVLVSRDSDFKGLLEKLQKLRQRVMLISPRTNNKKRQVNTPSDLRDLVLEGDIIDRIFKNVFKKHLFPNTVCGITKPNDSTWIRKK